MKTNRKNDRPIEFGAPRLNLMLTALFAIFMAGAMAIFTLHTISKEAARITTSMKLQAQVLAENLAATSGDFMLSDDYTAIEHLLFRSAKFPGIISLQISDKDGKLIGNVLNTDGREPEALYGQKPLITPNKFNPTSSMKIEQDLLIVWQPIILGDLIGWVKIIYGLDEIKKVQNDNWRDFSISSLIIIFVASAMLIMFLRRPIKAIERYTEFSDRLDGAQGEQVSVSSYSLEMQKLGNALNRASIRLNEQNTAISDGMKELKRLAVFPENNPNITLSLNRSGKVEYINPHGKEMINSLNLPENEIIWLLPENIIEIMDKCFSDLKTLRGIECTYLDHTYRWTFAPVEGQGLVHCYALEITESRKAQEEAHASHLEKLTAEAEINAQNTFLANISLEMRTPLTAIIGFSECMLENKLSEADSTFSVEAIVRNSKNLLHVIDDTLDLSKIAAKNIKIEQRPISPFTVMRDIESIIQLQAKEKGLDFSVDYDFPIPETIKSDPTRLKQILFNLCNNAVKFTDAGSVHVKVSYNSSAKQMEYEIRDTGIGINEEQIPKLFNSLFQKESSSSRHDGGTGIGLYISKQLSELLGGTITVSSEPDKGSCFTATINSGNLEGIELLDTCPELTNGSKIAKNSDGKTGNSVLLIEQNEDDQKLISMYTQRHGANVRIANNGFEAVEMIQETDYDLIFIDMQTSVRDGQEAVRLLRYKGYTKPIIALVASSSTKRDIELCKDAGCNEIASKPIKRRPFSNILDRFLVFLGEDI